MCKFVCVKFVCVKLLYVKAAGGGGGREEAGRRPGYRIKNKNPTQRCGELLAPKLRKSADKSLSQPGCSHSNTIYVIQLQNTIVLRMQPLQRATLTQPLRCDLRRMSCKSQ